jgi:hypothetical protein
MSQGRESAALVLLVELPVLVELEVLLPLG